MEVVLAMCHDVIGSILVENTIQLCFAILCDIEVMFNCMGFIIALASDILLLLGG